MICASVIWIFPVLFYWQQTNGRKCGQFGGLGELINMVWTERALCISQGHSLFLCSFPWCLLFFFYYSARLDDAYLQELQKSWFGHARLFNERHRIGKVVDVVAVHIQHHGFGKLQTNGHKEQGVRCYCHTNTVESLPLTPSTSTSPSSFRSRARRGEETTG